MAEIAADGGKASLSAGFELAERTGSQKLVADTVKRHGKLDIVVLCGADAPHGAVVQMADADFDQLAKSNFYSLFCFAKDPISELAKGGARRSVSIYSWAGIRLNTPGIVPCGASKAAINSMICGLAVEYGGLGITVNAIDTGLIASDRIYLSPDRVKALHRDASTSGCCSRGACVLGPRLAGVTIPAARTIA